MTAPDLDALEKLADGVIGGLPPLQKDRARGTLYPRLHAGLSATTLGLPERGVETRSDLDRTVPAVFHHHMLGLSASRRDAKNIAIGDAFLARNGKGEG